MNEELIKYLGAAINEVNTMFPDNPIGIEAQSQILNQLSTSGKPLHILNVSFNNSYNLSASSVSFVIIAIEL